MLKLKKYIGSFWLPIVLVIGLLYGQAQSELSLPDYMSNIVSVGIQSGGFDSPVNDLYTSETYEHMQLFMDENQKEFVNNHFTEVKGNELSNGLQEKYSDIQDNESYYLCDELTSDQREELEQILLEPMLLTSMIATMDKTSDQYQQMFATLPEGMNEFDAIKMMPKEVLASMQEEVSKQIESMGASTSSIAAGNGVKVEYTKLGGDVEKAQSDYILHTGMIMLVIALIGTTCAISVSFLASRIGAGIARRLRKDVFEKVASFSSEEYGNFSTASLITRTTNDITQIQMVMTNMLRVVFFSPMMGLGALVKVLDQSPSMTWIIFVVLIVMCVVIGLTFSVAVPKFKIIQQLIDKLNLTMRENLSGMLVVRAFGNESFSEERFDNASIDLTKVNLFVNRVMSSLMPLMMFIFNGVTLVIVWFGSKQIDLGNLDIGQMLAFMQYAMQIIMSFLMISMIAIMLPRASVAAGRIVEILETRAKIIDPIHPKEFDQELKGVIEFKDVSFGYPGAHEPILKDITFTAKPGQTTAFIGSTGSGKSTLINLIPRFYEATSGEVLVSGVNVKDVKQHDLREHIGIVPQVNLLFSGTVRSNITYGIDDASDEQLDEIVRVSQATEFVEKLPDGYNSEITQGGSNVSGGQKQRLAIARALAKKADILLFDDSFSALDFKTDAKLRQELEIMTKQYNSTVLVVGQRISSIMSADQIIVLDEGKIVGKGTHEDLMKACEVYQEIAYSQLSKEELENE